MTDTPEIAAWLTRFEKRFGETQTASALQQLRAARELFYNELGYNITRRQFEALKGESDFREGPFKELGIKVEQGRTYRDKEHRDIVNQQNYRDIKTGQFMKRVDVEELILQSQLDDIKVRPAIKFTDPPKPRQFNRRSNRIDGKRGNRV